MPLELQPKLLRALQEREFSAVGSSELRRLQARITAASNQDLEAAVAARRFREDLYFRLRVIPIFCRPCANGGRMCRNWRSISCVNSLRHTAASPRN